MVEDCVGETTNVSAMVERVERYAVGALDITELFLSGFDANTANYRSNAGADYTTFLLGETITTELQMLMEIMQQQLQVDFYRVLI